MEGGVKGEEFAEARDSLTCRLLLPLAYRDGGEREGTYLPTRGAPLGSRPPHKHTVHDAVLLRRYCRISSGFPSSSVGKVPLLSPVLILERWIMVTVRKQAPK